MRSVRAPLALILALLLLLPLFSAFTATAADSDGTAEAEYTQKVVAVVYDNSGSMTHEDDRIPSARYSLALLLSMLDKRDALKIFPMNNCPDGIPVDLSDKVDRSQTIQSVLGHSAITNHNGSYTRTDSTKKAISYLKDNDMKDESTAGESKSDKEYWLIILTDGQFNNKNDVDYQATTVKDLIAPYPTMNTVYVSFGSSAIDISDHPDLADLKKTEKFMPFCQVPAGQLPSTMQEISNKISSRYPLTKGTQYTVSGNTVTIDLDKIPFSVSGFSVVAQGCGATVNKNGGAYTPPPNGSATAVSLHDICAIGGSGFLVDLGCSFKVTPATNLNGGTLTLTFSDTINDDYLAIYADPAFDLSYYVEAEGPQGWHRISDVREITSNMRPGDRIRVGYEVYDPVKKETLNLDTVFTDVVADVFYNNDKYATLEPIELVKGSLPLSVRVSVMGGDFTLRDSVVLTVQEDPSHFRVEVMGDTTVSGVNPSTTPIFTVFINNVPASKDQLSDFRFTAKVTADLGGDLFEKEVDPYADGTIRIPLDFETNKFDVYNVSLLVESPQYLPLTAEYSVTYVPDNLSLTLEGDQQLSITQYDLKSNTQGFTFVLTANGQPFPLKNDLIEYKLTVGGKEVAVEATGNTLTFVPTDQNLNGLHRTPDDYEVKLELTSAQYPNLATSASASLIVIKTVYTVVPVAGGNADIKPLDLKNSDAALFFSVERDGIALTESEMKGSLTNGDFDVDADAMFKLFFLPASLSTDIRIVNGVAVLAVTAGCDMNDYLDWHLSTLITTGNKPITVSYLEAEATQSFTVLSSNAFLWTLRFLLMILVIVWLIHLIPFVISLFVAKPLPRGTLVYLYGGESQPFDINIHPVKRILLAALWILVRFLCPFLEFMDQKLWFQNPGLSEFALSFNRKNGLHFKPEDPEIYFRARIKGAQRPTISRFYNGVRDGQQTTLKEFTNQDNRSFSLLNYYEKASQTPLRDDTACQIAGGNHYGIFVTKRSTGEVKLSSLVTFVAY